MSANFVQIAYLANDLEQKCAALLEAFDIGPFIVARKLELTHHVYKGQPCENFVVDAAFAQSGDLNIEILQMRSSGPNAISDMFANGREGVHHAAYFCADIFAEKDKLTRLGYPPVSEFMLGDINLCFSDTRALFGHMVELYQDCAELRELYRRTRALRGQWDGKTLFYDW